MPSPKSVVTQVIGLLLWIGVTSLPSLAGGFFRPGEWYQALDKPAWTPPGWIFGPVWTLLYLMMAVAAWLIWRQGGWAAQRRPLTVYLIQLLLNGLWSWFFFGLQNPGLALLDILLLLAFIITLAVLFWRQNKIAGALLFPYIAWVSFATALNAAIWIMN